MNLSSAVATGIWLTSEWVGNLREMCSPVITLLALESVDWGQTSMRRWIGMDSLGSKEV